MSGPNTSQIAVIPTLNNNFPCEGPKDVPIPFNFDPVTGQGATQQVNLQQLQQNNSISEVQSFFVDNSQNANQLTISVVGTNQKIILPPNSQAYLPVLMGQIQFTVSTTLANNLIITIHCLNIPVVSCVWSTLASGGGGSGGNVNITEVGGANVALGQNTAAESIPVVLSSDNASTLNLTEVGGAALGLGQKAAAACIPVVLSSTSADNGVSLNDVGGSPIAIGSAISASCLPVVLASDQNAATPGAAGTAQNIAVTTSSSNTALAGTGNYLFTNIGSGIVYMRFGASAQTAVVGDMAIPPNGYLILHITGSTLNVGVIGSAASTLNVAPVTGGIVN
jgi:hypothetical protein